MYLNCASISVINWIRVERYECTARVGEKRNACRILEGKLESDDLDDIYGWMNLKLALAKDDGRVFIGFTRHVVGTGGGLLLRRWWTVWWYMRIPWLCKYYVVKRNPAPFSSFNGTEFLEQVLDVSNLATPGSPVLRRSLSRARHFSHVMEKRRFIAMF